MKYTCWEEAGISHKAGECHQDCVLFEVQSSPCWRVWMSAPGRPRSDRIHQITTVKKNGLLHSKAHIHWGYFMGKLSFSFECQLFQPKAFTSSLWHKQVLKKPTAHPSPSASFSCTANLPTNLQKPFLISGTEIALETSCSTILCGCWCCKVCWKQSHRVQN